MTWHIDPPTWSRFAEGRLDYAAQSAVESHLTGCSFCQQQAAAATTEASAVWLGVRDRIARPEPAWPLRWLRRLGLSDADIVVLGASDNLRLPWAVAVGGALASVILAANLGRFENAAFLLIGPLVPALAVLAAYDATDPLRLLTASTPYSKIRLSLLRTLATLLVALPTMVGLSAAVPGLRELTWVWLLPSLGLTAVSLFALRWLSAWQTGCLVAAVWAATVVTVASAGQLSQMGSGAGQWTFAVVTAVCLGIVTASHANLRAEGDRP